MLSLEQWLKATLGDEYTIADLEYVRWTPFLKQNLSEYHAQQYSYYLAYVEMNLHNFEGEFEKFRESTEKLGASGKILNLEQYLRALYERRYSSLLLYRVRQVSGGKRKADDVEAHAALQSYMTYVEASMQFTNDGVHDEALALGRQIREHIAADQVFERNAALPMAENEQRAVLLAGTGYNPPIKHSLFGLPV